LVDIYPTLAELTGLTPPGNLQGYSLLPLLQNPDAEWQHPAFTQVQRGNTPGHSVRTEVWRFTEWGFGKMGEELYNEDADPQELNNLAGNPKYAAVRQQMKELLHTVHPIPVTGGIAVEDTKQKYSN
jgi:arylsulfatase A-like enzyme